MACFLLTAQSKMQERKELKKELLRKKEPEFEDVENSHLSKLQKTRKLVLKGTLRVWGDNHLIKS